MACAGGEIVWTSRGLEGGAGGDRVTLYPSGHAAKTLPLPSLPHLNRAGSLNAFITAIRTGVAPETSVRDNLGSVALMEAVLESATSGVKVELLP